MSEPLTATWLDRWYARITNVLRELPGDNHVRSANAADLAAFEELLDETRMCSPDLETFYHRFGEVALPGIESGLFIHSPRWVLEHYRENQGAVLLLHADDPHGLVVGSDGKDLLYVQDWGGAVHRSIDEPGPGQDPDQWIVYTTRQGAKRYYDFEYVADRVPEFLTFALDAALHSGWRRAGGSSTAR